VKHLFRLGKQKISQGQLEDGFNEVLWFCGISDVLFITGIPEHNIFNMEDIENDIHD
jgi:hypothetical protein